MNSCRILPAMRTLAILTISLLRCFLGLFRSREEQAIVELALRQQLAVYAQKRPRPKLSPLDRAFWVALSRLWPRWKNHLVVVRPEIVLRNHKDVISGMDFFVVPTVRFRLLEADLAARGAPVGWHRRAERAPAEPSASTRPAATPGRSSNRRAPSSGP